LDEFHATADDDDLGGLVGAHRMPFIVVPPIVMPRVVDRRLSGCSRTAW
jgi:hypothetical protein